MGSVSSGPDVSSLTDQKKVLAEKEKNPKVEEATFWRESLTGDEKSHVEDLQSPKRGTGQICFTFKVDNVSSAGPESYGQNNNPSYERIKKRRMFDGHEVKPDRTLQEAWQRFGIIEAMSAEPEGLVEVFTKQNLLVKAVHESFYGHHPLILSPDIIWLTIAQGLSNHIDQNVEKLRKEFVHHKGKKALVIQRSNFVKGSDRNDWEGVFPEFSDLIRANTTAGTVDLIECEFSTTGPVEKVVSHITLMDAVQHYFTYSLRGGCGIPEISLTGTVEDWEKIRSKAEKLKKYDLDWWLSALLPALDQFVEAAKGKPDHHFWRSLCHFNVGMSSSIWEPVTGWIQVFYPYLISPRSTFEHRHLEKKNGKVSTPLKKNSSLDHYLDSFKEQVDVVAFEKEVENLKKETSDRGIYEKPRVPRGTKKGVKLEEFPPSLSSAPFIYKDLMTGKKHSMTFMGGITTLVQHADGAIEPKCGWAVIDSGKYDMM